MRCAIGDAEPVIPADGLRPPLNSNVRPLMTNPEWTSKGKTVGQLFEEPIGWVGFINPAIAMLGLRFATTQPTKAKELIGLPMEE